MKKKLYRSKQNRIILGLCGGIARYFNLNPTLVRILCFFSGIGIITYFIICLLVPENPMI